MIAAVVGPTASGKTALALRLAKALPNSAEIVNADAFALYKGMDIGTAKPTSHQREQVRHHQVDVLELWEEASVRAYQSGARQDVLDIISRGKTPIVVGGSGLYVRALLDQLSFPPTDPHLRQRLEKWADEEGSAVLHEKLMVADPEAASRIHPNNSRRVVRALEVVELTGKPFSASLPKRDYWRETVQIGTSWDLDDLEGRIAARTEAMFEDGLVAEVEELAKRGLAENRTASRATGYKQVLDMLETGQSVSEAMEATRLATSQLARRQLKWFRADPRISWVDADASDAGLEQALAVLSHS